MFILSSRKMFSPGDCVWIHTPPPPVFKTSLKLPCFHTLTLTKSSSLLRMPPHDQMALKRILPTKIIITLFIFLRAGLEEGQEGRERKGGTCFILSDPNMQINKASLSGYLLSKTSPTPTAFFSSSPEIELLTPPKVKTFSFCPRCRKIREACVEMVFLSSAPDRVSSAI